MQWGTISGVIANLHNPHVSSGQFMQWNYSECRENSNLMAEQIAWHVEWIPFTGNDIIAICDHNALQHITIFGAIHDETFCSVPSQAV